MKLIFTFALLIGWTRAETCPPVRFDQSDLDRPINIADLVKAKLVVIARVTDVRGIGDPETVAGFPRLHVQCEQIKIDVEGTLKGQLSDQKTSLIYYTLSKFSRVDLGSPKYLPVIGERRLFFLRTESGLIRFIGDVRDYTIPIFGGYHDPASLASLPFGQKVGVVLLTLGKTYNLEAFANRLPLAVFVSDQLNSIEFTDSLLERLHRAQEPEIILTIDQIIADRTKRKSGHKLQ